MIKAYKCKECDDKDRPCLLIVDDYPVGSMPKVCPLGFGAWRAKWEKIAL